MRVNRDVVANVTRNGETLYSSVRVLRDSAGRVAVFPDVKAAPIVYPPGEVEFQPLRTPCSCKGDPPRVRLTQLWQRSEAASV